MYISTKQTERFSSTLYIREMHTKTTMNIVVETWNNIFHPSDDIIYFIYFLFIF